MKTALLVVTCALTLGCATAPPATKTAWREGPADPLADLVPAGPAGPFGGGTVSLEDGTKVPLAPLGLPSDDERALLSRFAAGDESGAVMLQAFARVSGASTAAEVARVVALAERNIELVRPDVEAAAGEAAKGRALLEALHRQLLRHYALEQDSPAVALETGSFNCVSSAVVYDTFAHVLGLHTIAANRVMHSYAMLVADGRRIEVQTTSPDGFAAPMTAAQFDDFLARRGLPAMPFTTPVLTGNAALFAHVLENRLSNHHDGSLDSTRPDAEPRMWAQVALTERMVLLSPRDPKYLQDHVAGWQQLMGFYEARERRPEAFAANREAHRAALAWGDPKIVAMSRTNVLASAEAWLDELLEAGRPRDALRVYDESRRLVGCPGPEACERLEAWTRNDTFVAAQACEARGDAAGAWALVDVLSARVPPGAAAGNFIHHLEAELGRRAKAGDFTGGEALATSGWERVFCARPGPGAAPACAHLASSWSRTLLASDPLRARAWARRALALDPD